MRWRIPLLGLLLLAACGATRPARPTYSPPAMRRADAAFDRRDYQEAVRIYDSFLRHRPPAELIPQATYKLALARFRLRDYAGALEALDRLRERFPDGRWVQVWTLYGDTEEMLGHRVTALIWWERAWRLATADQEGQLSARILGLAARLSEAERNRARSLVTTEFVRRALQRPRAAGPVTPRPATPPGAAVTAAVALPRIAVLLPLSGAHAVLGENSLEGARLAVADDGKLVIRDTAGSQAKARAAIRELVADPDVVAVVGPLASSVAEAVAPEAEHAGLPLILLSQREGLAGRFVMQPAMTPGLQAETLIDYAVRRRALRHLAIVYPATAYGRRMRAAFRVSAEANGGLILGEITYTPGQQEFDGAVDRLREMDESGRLDAVFIPDAAEVVALIAPRVHQLLPEVQLLGTADWDEPFVLQSVAPAVEGAIFVDGFFAESARGATRSFVDEFSSRYGRRPGILEAQAYDAAGLLEAVVSRGARTRKDVRGILDDYGLYEGAGGALDLHGGTAHRRLFVLTVRNGNVVELQP